MPLAATIYLKDGFDNAGALDIRIKASGEITYDYHSDDGVPLAEEDINTRRRLPCHTCEIKNLEKDLRAIIKDRISSFVIYPAPKITGLTKLQKNVIILGLRQVRDQLDGDSLRACDDLLKVLRQKA